ncbi:MAG: phosphate ABC transporter permease subunit PstC [Bacteroidota bacterium]
MSSRIVIDNLTARTMRLLTWLSIVLMLLIGLGLFLKAWPILKEHSIWEMLSGDVWMPFKKQFGFYPFIMGTIWVTVLAIILSFPLCLLTAIYISEYAPSSIRKAVIPLIELLAGVPPVVYGVWGILTIVPLISDHIAPHFVEFSTGYSVLAGGIILAIMIFPLIISILGEVFNAIPQELRDASLSLGASKWQTTKFVVVRKAVPGIIASIVLALSRALGETIAVLMVCGNIAMVPHSVFDSCYPLPALIANNYGEMMSIPLYDSALMLAAFILFVLIITFNLFSRFTLTWFEKRFKI